MTVKRRIAILAMVGLCAMAAVFIVHGAFVDGWAEGTDRYLPLAFLGFIVIGAYSIVRRPEQRIGWVMAGIGVSLTFALTGGAYVLPLFPESSQAWIATFGVTLSRVGIGTLIPLFFLWYPTGFVASESWRWLERSVIIVSLVHAGYYTLRPGPTDALWEKPGTGLDNPVGLDVLAPLRGGPAEIVAGLALGLLVLGALVSLIARYRRDGWEVRQQIRLVLYPTLLYLPLHLLAVFPFASRFPSPNSLAPFAAIIAMNGVAIGVGIAIARYRLFEVDRVIARTVSYTVIVGLLALLFAAGVVWIPSALGLDDTPLLVAASTLAVAALFSPLRRWVHGAVDRRFNRARYDAERVVDRFAGSLRDEVEVEQVVSGWKDVVSETMQPNAIGVWVRVS